MSGPSLQQYENCLMNNVFNSIFREYLSPWNDISLNVSSILAIYSSSGFIFRFTHHVRCSLILIFFSCSFFFPSIHLMEFWCLAITPVCSILPQIASSLPVLFNILSLTVLSYSWKPSVLSPSEHTAICAFIP